MVTKKFILGMIHLGGDNVVKRALDEIKIYAEEGVDGCIIENYHGSFDDVVDVLKKLQDIKAGLRVGINILPNEYKQAFEIGNRYSVDFIQLDHVAGVYGRGVRVDVEDYLMEKDKHWHKPLVYGGVWPKYYQPMAGSVLEDDINAAIPLCDGIVVTGSGTGKETPLGKIKKFKEIIGDKTELIVGAGVDVSNVAEQLAIADGAIVGSCFKQYKLTQEKVSRSLVQEFMREVMKLNEVK